MPGTTLAMREGFQQSRGRSREVARLSGPQDVFKPLDPATPEASPTLGFLVMSQYTSLFAHASLTWVSFPCNSGVPDERNRPGAQHYRGPQRSCFNLGNVKPQPPSSQTDMPTHTQHRRDHFLTCNRHRLSQSREAHADARTRLHTPHGEENSQVDTLTPADGIQVAQGPAAAHRPGQRPVPP